MKQINQRILRMILPFLMGIFLSSGVFAQQLTVKGHVKDVKGEPVIGASVLVKGTTIGTITDFDGNFVLNASQNSILEISFIGYKNVEVKAASTVMVIMQEDAVLLDEAVVIGYGVVKKSDATGSVTAIKPDKISKGITISAQDMITGKIAGVNVTSNGGKPGDGGFIRIRGGSSLAASNDPLIVIDGLAMDNDGIKGMSNALAMVNPNDIETFTVLKDASATAIYGSRASNGVIIITTKKGASGSKPQVNYDGYVSFGVKRNKVDVMNGDEYREYINQLYGDDLPHELGKASTDWQDEIFHTAVSHDHNVTVSGGLKNLPYRVSFGITNQQGIIKTSEFDRYTASVSLTPSFFNEHLKFNINAKAMYAKNRYADTGVLGSAIAMDPTRPVRADGYEKFGGYWQWTSNSEYKDPDWPLAVTSLAVQNPVAMLKLKNDRAKSSSFIGNAEVDYKFHFLPDLHVHANIGGDYSEGTQKIIYSPYSFSNHYYGRNEKQQTWKYNVSANAYLQYKKKINDHFIDVMAGAEQQHFHRTGHTFEKGTYPQTGEPYDVKDMRYGLHNSLVSYFGRLNYSFLDRYLLTATIRQDGTSRFSKADGNRWGTFPAFALGWKIKEESFLKNVDFLSDLKLRLGWGVTGQQNIGNDFDYLPLYVTNKEGAYYMFGNDVVSTMRPEAYNSKLKWEETTTWNAGLDFSFLNGRISTSIDYYYRTTKDLLNRVKIAAGTNFSNMLIKNIGTLENHGIEFSINAKPIVTNDLIWNVDYNITYNKNKITKLAGSDDKDYYVATGDISSGTGSRIQAHQLGYPAYSFRVYQQVYDEKGKPIENLFVDRNGDGMINDADKYLYKKAVPDVTMGLTSKLIWRNWDFSFALRASFNNYVYNDIIAGRANVSSNAMWSNSGFYSNRPVEAVKLGFQGVGDFYMSDYFIQNASFVRCDNITLGYSFKTLGINGRIYTTVQNPFVITKYDGLDPEIGYSTKNDRQAFGSVDAVDGCGVDRNLYPRPVSFLLGVSFQF